MKALQLSKLLTKIIYEFRCALMNRAIVKFDTLSDCGSRKENTGYMEVIVTALKYNMTLGYAWVHAPSIELEKCLGSFMFSTVIVILV